MASRCCLLIGGISSIEPTVHTPAFLLWSLEYTCQVRGFETGHDPERIERLLRAARVASDAIAEGRVLEGICLSPPYGFRLNEALALYGGLATVEVACNGCPANAASRVRAGTWAGCFGMVPIASGEEIARQLAKAFGEPGMRSPLNAEQAGWLATFIAEHGLEQVSKESIELLAGLRIAAAENLPIHVVMYPPGRVEDGWWRLAVHCPRCKAVWGEATVRQCVVCGYVGAPAPDKKRRARGRRPYLLLERLMGSAAATEFLQRYEALRARQELPGPAGSLLPPEPRGNPPDG